MVKIQVDQRGSWDIPEAPLALTLSALVPYSGTLASSSGIDHILAVVRHISASSAGKYRRPSSWRGAVRGKIYSLGFKTTESI